jgi:hypothetical protein
LQRDAEENALAAPARLVGRRIHAAMLSLRGAASIAALAPCVLGATALSDRWVRELLLVQSRESATMSSNRRKHETFPSRSLG